PQVNIIFGGTATAIAMEPEGNTAYVNGRVYVATTTLSDGDNYTYYFSDKKDSPSNSPTCDGPDVYPNGMGIAFLDWTGSSGYEDDCVEPDIASYGSTFTYRIKYVNVDGIPPDAGYPKIFDNSMTWVSGTSATGAIYQYERKYSSLDIGTATGNISESTQLEKDIDAYVANIPPLLTWTGAQGYTDDGVQPNIGTTGTIFTFRIKYMDPEGDAPQGVALMMDGTSASMALVSNGIYECKKTFSLGEQNYWFYACDSMNVNAGGSETVVNSSDLSQPVDIASFIVSIGSLTSVTITGTEAVGIDETATFIAHAFNEKQEEIGDSDVGYFWEIIEGTGTIIGSTGSKTVTLKAGTSTGTITLQVTASSSNIILQGDNIDATKTITIKPGKPTTLFFSGTETNALAVELPLKSSAGFAISGRDGYGNVTLIEDCIWMLEGAIGTLSSLSNKATFTAGAVTETGALVVSTMGADGTLTATVSITIIAGEFDHFDISVETTPIRVDGTITITLVPKDVSSNTVIYNGTSSPWLKVTVGTNSANLGTCAINTPVEFPWPSTLRNKFGTSTIYASINGSNKGTSSPFQVVAGSPHH
ncbi:MAG: hypothetical protein AAB296_03735, partial [Candidatus Desantisbacteria bacterium]